VSRKESFAGRLDHIHGEDQAKILGALREKEGEKKEGGLIESKKNHSNDMFGKTCRRKKKRVAGKGTFGDSKGTLTLGGRTWRKKRGLYVNSTREKR